MLITFAGFGISAPYIMDEPIYHDDSRHAISILYPRNDSKVMGIVSFKQYGPHTPIYICCSVKGLHKNNKHGITIHEFGDLTNE